jgi:hypothetical protein
MLIVQEPLDVVPILLQQGYQEIDGLANAASVSHRLITRVCMEVGVLPQQDHNTKTGFLPTPSPGHKMKELALCVPVCRPGRELPGVCCT